MKCTEITPPTSCHVALTHPQATVALLAVKQIQSSEPNEIGYLKPLLSVRLIQEVHQYGLFVLVSLLSHEQLTLLIESFLFLSLSLSINKQTTIIMMGNNLSIAAAVGGGLFVAYCLYFDHKRRSDPLFKQKLKARELFYTWSQRYPV